MADILSVLALTMSVEGERVCACIDNCLPNCGRQVIFFLFEEKTSSCSRATPCAQLLKFDVLVVQESLKFRLLGSEGDIGSWGHEYVRYEPN